MSSSLGGSWRVLRRQLAGSALGAELDKLLQRFKPEAPEHWDKLVKRVEQAVARMSGELSPAAARPGRREEAGEGAGEQEAAPPAPPAPAVAAGEREQGAGPSLAPSVPAHLKDMSLEGLWAGLRLKKDLTLGNVSQPGWKTTKPVVTKTSIHSRTAYVISALVEARSAACLAKRTEDFVHHIQTYPEARDYAVKEGAVRVLLRVQRGLPADSAVWGAVNEALALVGWCPPPRGRGPRILALDGGGVRGIVAIEVLRHLEAVTGRPARDLFDFVVGVSTGAIIAAVVAGERGSLDTAAALYRTLARDMFGNTSVLGGASRLVWTQAYYDTPAWEQLLRQHLGEERVTRAARRGPRLALVSARVAEGGAGGGRLAPYVFRSYAGRYRVRPALGGGSDALVWHAVRASAAAPTYFEEFPLRGAVHHDGGLLVNNPAGVALHEARLQYGSLAGATLVSLGCGRAAPPPPARAPSHSPAATSWRDKFNAVLDSATDTEGVHLLLNEVLPAGSYYRVNPPLTAPCAMDEVRPERLQAVLDDTHAYIRRNQDKLQAAARALTRPRSLLQRAADALHHRAVCVGLAH